MAEQRMMFCGFAKKKKTDSYNRNPNDPLSFYAEFS